VFNCHTLHLELTAGVSVTAHVHSPWVEDVDPEEAAAHKVLKPVLSLAPL